MSCCRIGNGTRLAVGRHRTSMDEQPVKPESCPIEESTRASENLSPGGSGARSSGPARQGQPRQATTKPQRVEIVLRIAATKEALQRTSGAGSDVSVASIPVGGSPTGAG